MHHWSLDYIGTPYAQADCAELAVQVQAEQFGRQLALPTTRDPGPFGLSAQISQQQADFAERTEHPEEGDAVLLRTRGRLNHIGIYCRVNDIPHVLHAMKRAGTCLHRLADLAAHQVEIEGFYKWL